MGLDMYLMRYNKDVLNYKEVYLPKAKEKQPLIYEALKPYIVMQGTPGVYTYETLYEEIGYWRKANAIHNWFVENVQHGTDDCREYEVCANQLSELRDTCLEVLGETVLINGTINNGYTMTPEGKVIQHKENGKVIINPEVAEEKLPSTSGFFFGSTDYDEYYVEDLKSTVEIINKTLNTTNWETHAVFYRSSW